MSEKKKDKRKYTVKDVAREAGVSTATVSRVLNESEKVSDQTVKKVLKAARKLNYKPSRVARRLRAKSYQSQVIGLIVTDIQNPFFSEVARGVEDLAYKSNNAVMVCNSDEMLERENFYINTLMSERVSGFIIAPTAHNEEAIQKLADNDYPVVCIDRTQEIPAGIDTVCTDNRTGAYKAVKRLIELGHRRIGIINGLSEISTTQERFQGYKDALEEAGIKVRKELVTFSNSKQDGGITRTRQLVDLDRPPTALFPTNNLMTLGSLEELHRQGISIPEDMALVGFDDMPWAVALNPPLTAIKQPSYEMGEIAAELLLRRLDDKERSTSSIVLDPRLIIRESCGKTVEPPDKG